MKSFDGMNEIVSGDDFVFDRFLSAETIVEHPSRIVRRFEVASARG
jgi:hypothetical protein